MGRGGHDHVAPVPYDSLNGSRTTLGVLDVDEMGKNTHTTICVQVSSSDPAVAVACL